MKEEQIEVKLASIATDWALQELVFQDYKTRGPVILKVHLITSQPHIVGYALLFITYHDQGQIEVKLASIATDWALQELVFQDYKTRGPVILKVGFMSQDA